MSTLSLCLPFSLYLSFSFLFDSGRFVGAGDDGIGHPRDAGQADAVVRPRRVQHGGPLRLGADIPER